MILYCKSRDWTESDSLVQNVSDTRLGDGGVLYTCMYKNCMSPVVSLWLTPPSPLRLSHICFCCLSTSHFHLIHNYQLLNSCGAKLLNFWTLSPQNEYHWLTFNGQRWNLDKLSAWIHPWSRDVTGCTEGGSGGSLDYSLHSKKCCTTSKRRSTPVF